MAAITSTTLDALLKELYVGQAVENAAFDAKARPFLSMVKKNTSFEGSSYPLPVIYDDAAGRSYNFTHAQANATDRPSVAFAIDIVENYSINSISTKALRRAKSSRGGFVNSMKHLVDSVIETLANDLERSLFQDGYGTLGTLASSGGVSGSTLTLATAKDALNFVEGQSIVAADSTSSALRSSTPGVIDSIDYVNGTITLTAAAAGTLAAQDGDLLFAEGDYDSASDRNKLYGLAAWLPSTAPTSGDSFNGVDRSANTVRLAGVRYSGSSGNVQESIINAAHSTAGYSPAAVSDVCFMSFNTLRNLVLELDSQVQRSGGGKASGGFSSVEVYGPKGPIQCVGSSFCPDDRAYLLQKNTWEFVSMGDAVSIINEDGSRIVRRDSSDAFEVRAVSFSNLACRAPGRNCVITL